MHKCLRAPPKLEKYLLGYVFSLTRVSQNSQSDGENCTAISLKNHCHGVLIAEPDFAQQVLIARG
jgi:hypothetical protein